MTAKVALVTGGGSGIGRAISHRLAADGYAVAVLDLNAAAAKTVVEEILDKGHTAAVFGDVDVSDRSQVDTAVEKVRESLGAPAVLVNNAGITGFKKFGHITDEVWARTLAINLPGPFYACQVVYRA
ncbi:SDR family NAD(P)-dependent oxidoreductase [Rhodococcus sp. MSC1_016]|jgi:2-hydroxycyclohexanecarboxyl-CoA dehydrogenase|uniref:SDR family NAD(P)-dependent oxidoreductase n=1 Tax=Rhodococcus sp. MSC1_016 TaxID=2909266 RepID=UPI0027E1C843|nr:SDR family NAD(P)-dependent oxidoreductase [Rhodococcus sp. MSC1_016]